MHGKMNLPKFTFGATGVFYNFQAKLKFLAEYEDLHSTVFKAFQSLGNCIAFFFLLDKALVRHELLRFPIAASALGLNVSNCGDDTAPATPSATVSQLVASVFNAESILTSLGNSKSAADLPDLVPLARRADEQYRPPSSRVSLFKSVLAHVQATMGPVMDTWRDVTRRPSNGVIDIESSREFYRLWSALQFVCD